MHGPAGGFHCGWQDGGCRPRGRPVLLSPWTWPPGRMPTGNYLYDFTKAAQAIRRILEINQQLPADRKIRVISMAFGWADIFDGYDEISAAVAEARAQGVLWLVPIPRWNKSMASSSSGGTFPLADPDLVTSYSRPFL